MIQELIQTWRSLSGILAAGSSSGPLDAVQVQDGELMSSVVSEQKQSGEYVLHRLSSGVHRIPVASG